MSDSTSRRGLLLPLVALLLAVGAAVFALTYEWGDPPVPADAEEVRRGGETSAGPLEGPPPTVDDRKPEPAENADGNPVEAPPSVAAPEGVTAPEGEGIVGILVDPEGNPLARARVTITRDIRDLAVSDPGAITRTIRVSAGGGIGFGRESGVTDRQGRFAIRKPGKDGKYDIGFKHPDYPAHTVTGVAWTAGSRVDLGVVRVPAGGIIFGFVRDEAGQPIAGARVRREKAGGGNSRVVSARSTVSIAISGEGGEIVSLGGGGGELTDDEGYFEMRKVPPGTYRLKAVVKGKADAVRESVNVSEGGRTGPVSLTPSPGLEISGVVVDERGGAVPGARITTFGGGKFRSARADAQGAFVLKGLSPGKYDLSASAGGANMWMGSGPTASQSVEAGTSGVRLELKTGLVLAGRIIDAATLGPVTGARVSLVKKGDGATFNRRMTRVGSSEFRFPNQKPGQYTIEVTARGYRKATSGPHILVEGRSIDDILIRLQPE